MGYFQPDRTAELEAELARVRFVADTNDKAYLDMREFYDRELARVRAQAERLADEGETLAGDLYLYGIGELPRLPSTGAFLKALGEFRGEDSQ
jgi:hypothetical protein